MKDTAEELREIAKRLVWQAKIVTEELGRIKSVWGAVRAVPELVLQAQILGEELKLPGPTKKAVVVQALLDLVPDRWVPDYVLEPMLSWLIERAVARLKQAGPRVLKAAKEALARRLR